MGELENGKGIGRRRDPRYVEESTDLSDWIQVKVARQFGDQVSINGLLWDLTPRAVRIAVPSDTVNPDDFPLSVGARTLLVFRFRNLATAAAQATVMRVDEVKDKAKGVVLYFDHIRDKDRAAIEQICRAYNKNEELRGDAAESAPASS
ncbi:MAG: hypothetical protein D6679_03405 [Candidatus Hydrogenedentota bacterium]|nr:MAG: hypothetical protein D6679_03405 [Candidatus Hydrogenedentota bacterium]